MKSVKPENWSRLLAHPIALEFPEIDADTFNDLIKSMKETGFSPLHPIVLFDGKILDGRNRFRAAKQIKADPVFVEFTGTEEEAVAFSITENLHRRHLTAGQRALIGDGLATFGHGGDRKSDQTANCQLDVNAASKRVHVAPRTVMRARELRKLDPARAKQVKEGKETLNGALNKARAAAKPKAPPKPSAPTDEAGVPIHPRAKDALGAGRDEAKRIVKALNTLKRETLAYAKGEYGRGLHAQTIETDFENIARQLRFGAPYSTCPLGDPCDAKCKLCRGTQWITESSYDGMPGEFKKKG